MEIIKNEKSKCCIWQFWNINGCVGIILIRVDMIKIFGIFFIVDFISKFLFLLVYIFFNSFLNSFALCCKIVYYRI